MDLSDRQRRILWLRAQGLSGPQIARREHIAVGTVDYHERVIVACLQARNITHAVHLAGMTGVIGAHEDCGDRAAYLRHLRHHETPCPACRGANAHHEAARRAGQLASRT